MAYYNMQGPAQYQQYQQSRKDQQMSNLLRMMMQMRAFKQRQEQFGVEQEASQRTQDWREQYQQQYMDYQKFQMDPERQRAMAKQKALGKQAGEGLEPEKPRAKLPANVESWAREKLGHTDASLSNMPDASVRQLVTRYEIAHPPEKPKKLTAYEMKKRDFQALVDTGELTQKQADAKHLGIKTKEELLLAGRTARDANKKYVNDVMNSVAPSRKKLPGKIRTILRDAQGEPPTVAGVRVDMPFAYNVAKENIEDGVITPEDTRIVEKYDAEFTFFQIITTGIDPRTGQLVDVQTVGSWKEFLQAKDKDGKPLSEGTDKAQMKLWFDIYK